MSKKNDYDVVIIGAGHNGLTTAGYLARKGLKVKVVEQRHVVGGAAVTEEFHPGFRNSIASYTVSLLSPKVVKDLELNKYGLNITTRDYSSLTLGHDNKFIHLTKNEERNKQMISKYSVKDAEGFEAMEEVLEQIADVLRDMVLETPPNVGGGLMDAFRAGKIANRVRKLSPELQREAIKLFTMSIADYLAEWMDSETLSGAWVYVGLVGNMQSIYAPGSAYVLLHHMFGEVNGIKGAWGHAQGGMGSITQAMARSAEAHGVDIELNAPVEKVLVENDIACGVLLKDGREIRARIVAANTNPKLLFTKLVDEQHVPADFSREMKNYRCRSGSLRMNLALSELPDFTCTRDEEDREQFMRGSILLSPSKAYAEKAYNDAMAKGWADEPMVEMFIPSLYDDSLAPEGKHVMSMFCQHFNPELPEGQTWDDVKEQVADQIIDTITQYAPNLKGAIEGRMILTPLDMERDFGLVGGDIFHGCLHMDQTFAMRPTAGYANYRMPVKNLYLCGAGAHPGGGVSGCPGHNAAREILKDLRWFRAA